MSAGFEEWWSKGAEKAVLSEDEFEVPFRLGEDGATEDG